LNYDRFQKFKLKVFSWPGLAKLDDIKLMLRLRKVSKKLYVIYNARQAAESKGT